MADILNHLRALEKQGEDNIWRTAKEAREEIERLRDELERYKKMAETRQTWVNDKHNELVMCQKQLAEKEHLTSTLQAVIVGLEQENQILIEELKDARAESGRFGVGA